MRKNDPIKHIMSEHTHTVQRGQAISDVFRLVHEHGIHHVPVLDGKKLLGIVSYTDLMKLSLGVQGYESNGIWSFIDSQHPLIEVMTAEPKTLHESSVVRDAAELLSDGGYHSLPVVDNENHLLGIVTSSDLIRYLCEQY